MSNCSSMCESSITGARGAIGAGTAIDGGDEGAPFIRPGGREHRGGVFEIGEFLRFSINARSYTMRVPEKEKRSVIEIVLYYCYRVLNDVLQGLIKNRYRRMICYHFAY